MPGGFQLGSYCIPQGIASNLAASTGTTIAAGSANVKGAWTQLTPATAYDMDGFYLSVLLPSTSRRYLLDIGIGAPGSEIIIMPDLGTGWVVTASPCSVYIPIKIPAGTRIAARVASTTASSVLDLTLVAASGSLAKGAGCSFSLSYGVVTGNTIGTTVSFTGTAANTKGPWVQIVSALTYDVKWLFPYIDFQNITTAQYLTDIGIGSVGNEIVLIPDLCYARNGQGFKTGFEIEVPAGTRIVARGACSSSTSSDRIIYVSITGVS